LGVWGNEMEIAVPLSPCRTIPLVMLITAKLCIYLISDRRDFYIFPSFVSWWQSWLGIFLEWVKNELNRVTVIMRKG